MKRGRLALPVTGSIVVVAVALLWWLAPTAKPEAPPPRQPTAQVVGRIELAVAAAGAAAPVWPSDATVVVYAYALDGPRLPLAVLRRPAAAVPFDFKLDDSLAPNPAFRLSQALQLVVGARLGQGEDSSPRPGDWLAASQIVPANAHGVRLILQAPVQR